MRFPLLIALIALVLNALMDVYIYMALLSYTRKRLWPQVQKWTAIGLTALLVVAILWPKGRGGEGSFAFLLWVLYTYLSVYIAKLIFIIFDVLSRLPMLWHKARWRAMSVVGAVIGVGVCLAMWWGALINRYRIQVTEQTVEIARLPESFDGFRIAQISDLHVGTFGDNPRFLNKLVGKVNALEPDIIVFTGDIVNRRSDELTPFVSVLAGLHAKYGVYSVLGNHDYGDYMSWDNDEAKAANLARLRHMQDSMGWQLLDNAHRWLKVGGDSIALIGVENVGDPPFRTYGELSAAYPDVSDQRVKVLLSHNPAHWDKDIQNNPTSNVDLTLSGHTHAMQIELFGLSPAAWRYPHWGGMYADSRGQRLYVNIGAGEVGMPARIGATPEITLITLKR